MKNLIGGSGKCFHLYGQKVQGCADIPKHKERVPQKKEDKGTGARIYDGETGSTGITAHYSLVTKCGVLSSSMDITWDLRYKGRIARPILDLLN